MHKRNQKSIRLLPDFSYLRTYSRSLFRSDIQAGLTVAVFAVPQVMAYAMLAGVPPVNGIYTVIVASVVAALWGRSPYVSTGPSNSAALLTAAAIAPFAGQGDPMQTVFVFALMVGLIRLALGLVRAGVMIEYVSEAAMLGFTVGIGTLIALGQLHHFIGVETSRHVWFVAKITEILTQVPEANPGAVLIAVGTIVTMFGLNRYSKRFPVALTAIVLATLFAELLGNRITVSRVSDIALVTSGLPAFRLHGVDLSILPRLFPIAVAVSIIGLVEVSTIAQIFATKHGERVNENQEFIGQGFAQIVSAFFQGIPCSGSFSRSAFLEHTGVRTRFGNVCFALCMAPALVFFARWLNYIPIAALAGLLFFIGFRLIDVSRVRRVMHTSRPDAAVMAITFLVTVFVHIVYGIFAGILASILMFLRRARILRMYELVPGDDARFLERPYIYETEHPRSDLVALSVTGDLFFAVAQPLRDRLTQVVEEQQPKHLILRMRRAYSIDYSCWEVLLSVASELQKRGGKLYLCGVQPIVEYMISRGGLDEVLPPEQIFSQDEALFGALHRAAAVAYDSLEGDVLLSPEWADYFDRREPAANESAE